VGSYAYVAGAYGLEVFDVSQPANLKQIGKYGNGDSVYSLEVVGNFAYLVGYRSGLQVVDVSDPTRPVRIGGYNTSANTFGVQVVGRHAYVVLDGMLQVVDVSHPANPIMVGGYGPNIGAAHVVGDYAYVTDGTVMRILKLRLGIAQSLEVQVPGEVPFQRSPLDRIGTASSGLPLTLYVVNGPATVINNELTLTGLGPVMLQIAQAGSEVFLPASADWIVNVTPPRLGVRLTGARVEAHWPAGIPELRLQVRQSLDSDSSWQDVTTPPLVADGEAIISVESSAPHRYLRLIRP